MTVMAAVVAADLLLMLGLGLIRLRTASAPGRQARRFLDAAEEARRLALHARIVDASMAELSELVIEQCLQELGMEVGPDPL
jgi:hypothetical protein